jgi:acetyl-CoA synthetase
VLSEIIRKTSRPKDPPPLLADYAAARSGFSWEGVAQELGTPLAGPMNLGGLAVSRGGGLVWHGARGEEERYSAADLATRSAQFANALKALGLQKGDRVIFLTRVIPELFFAMLGTLRFGACLSLLGRQRNVDALRNVFKATGAALVVLEADAKSMVDSLRAGAPQLKHVILVQRDSAPVTMRAGDTLWVKTVDGASGSFQDVPVAPDHPALIHYTEVGMSGAVAAHRSAFALSSSAALALDLRAGEGMITLTVPGDPLFVPYVLLAPLLRGATTFAFEEPVRFAGFERFKDPVHVWYSSVRAIDVVLRNDPGLARLLSGCRHIAVPHPYDTAFMIMTGPSYGSPLHPTWWPRELGAIVSAEYRAHDVKAGSIGRALPGVEMQVDAETGKLAVRIGSGSPFVGYWGDKEQTERRLKKGWFVTDQRAKMDPDGYAWIVA